MSTFRAAYYTGSVVQILTSFIHLTAHFQKPAPTNDQEKQLLGLMASYKMDFGAGFLRSMGDLVAGFSLQYSIFILMVGLINVLALRQVREGPFVRTLCWVNFIFMGICSVNAYIHFFLPPLTLFVLPTVAFLIAALTAPLKD